MRQFKTISIKNIYYMLSYAFQVLNEESYEKIAGESFEGADELLSEILIIGVSKQIKQGLDKDYVEINQVTPSIRGKINITDSINSLSFLKGHLNCNFDEFSLNSYLNQILKSTMNQLIKTKISNKRKKKLKRLLYYFHGVDLIDLKGINWKIRFNSNNQNYMMLINICYLICNYLVLSDDEGIHKITSFTDNQLMSHLYEKFILNYFKKEYPEVNTGAFHINWQVDDGFDYMLPQMRSDVTLEYNGRVVIIDAKFYSQNLQRNHDVDTHISSNLYQIFAYVKNKQEEIKGNGSEVSGVLLYAKTNADIQPNNEYVISGNRIAVKTLDLNQDFEMIKKELDSIVVDYLS